MDKHLRPYKCTFSSCKVRDFGNAGDLRRHRASVHKTGNLSFHCSVVGCKRQRQGFKRKDNLSEHLKRVHKIEKTKDFGTVVLSTNALNDKAGQDDESESSGDDEAVGNTDVSVAQSLDKLMLVEKLEELEKEKDMFKARFDAIEADIKALKRVSALMS